MDKIRCPRCIYYSIVDKAPIGKEPRNKYCFDPDKIIYDDCYACSGTGYIQSVVINEIRRCFPMKANDILRTENEVGCNLKWGGDHFYFMVDGIYVGCEIDGYCHS